MFYYQVLGILLSVSLRMHQSESSCKIYPVETRLGPSSSDVTLGGLKCSSTVGVNFASSSWIRNGTAIERKYIQENKEKIWTAVSFVNFSTAEDGETFECQISYPNNGGTSKCHVTLGKPRLRKLEPKIFDESNNPVDNIQWKCVIESGWPIPILSWWKDGSEISNGDFGKTRYIWYSKDKKVLTLSILRLNGLHHGKYTCRAENMFGNSTENTRLLINRHEMIRFRPDLKTTEILEGQNITLECICSAKECLEQPASSAYWRFNDRDIPRIERLTFLHKVTGGHVIISLIIRNVSMLDDGSYLCGINTSKGFDEASKRLHVVTRDMFPRVLAKGKEVSVHPYSRAFLKCSVIYPLFLKRAPNPFWTKDNKSSLDPQHYKQANSPSKEGPDSTRILDFHLIISNVTLKDYGGYSCGATINIGRSVIHLLQNLTIIMKQIKVSGGVTDKKDWLGTNENSPDTLSLIAAGSAAVGFAMGVIFVAYKMCQSRGYTWKSFFDVPVDSLSCQFQYDVFITFSSQDSNWVKKELIPLVEKHYLNYCIYDRDFEVGKPVVDNAAHSVYTSRKVLAVMSHNYMSSEFCRGELEMALYRCAKMGDPCVIVIRIDSIDLRKMPKALRNRTFLDYYDLIERKTWKERLIKYLKPPPFVETVISSQKIHGFTENNFQNYASV